MVGIFAEITTLKKRRDGKELLDEGVEMVAFRKPPFWTKIRGRRLFIEGELNILTFPLAITLYCGTEIRKLCK
jgi:hypothetical protein